MLTPITCIVNQESTLLNINIVMPFILEALMDGLDAHTALNKILKVVVVDGKEFTKLYTSLEHNYNRDIEPLLDRYVIADIQYMLGRVALVLYPNGY